MQRADYLAFHMPAGQFDKIVLLINLLKTYIFRKLFITFPFFKNELPSKVVLHLELSAFRITLPT